VEPRGYNDVSPDGFFACGGAEASWTAVALHRFGIGGVHSKRQRAGAVQNLAVIRTVHGKSSIVTQMRANNPNRIALRRACGKISG